MGVENKVKVVLYTISSFEDGKVTALIAYGTRRLERPVFLWVPIFLHELVWVQRERERKRSILLNPILSVLTQVAGFTSCFLEVCKYHHALRFVDGIFLFQFNLIDMFFYLSFPSHIWSPAPSFSRHFKIRRLFQNITIIPSQNTHTIVLRPPWLVHPKYPINPENSISSWLLLFSINLTLHIALIVAFSVLLKIAISFSLWHHVSLTYSIADLTQLW